MKSATIIFKALSQKPLEGGGGAGAPGLRSTVEFDLQIGRQRFPGMEAELRQTSPHGSLPNLLEASWPTGPYRGPWNQQAFTELCETYIRRILDLTPSAGRAFGLATNGNRFETEWNVAMQIPD